MTAETLEKANGLKLEIERIATRLAELDEIYHGVVANQAYGTEETDVEFHIRTYFGDYQTVSTRSTKITTTNVLDFVAIEIKSMTERKAVLEKELDEL